MPFNLLLSHLTMNRAEQVTDKEDNMVDGDDDRKLSPAKNGKHGLSDIDNEETNSAKEAVTLSPKSQKLADYVLEAERDLQLANAIVEVHDRLHKDRRPKFDEGVRATQAIASSSVEVCRNCKASTQNIAMSLALVRQDQDRSRVQLRSIVASKYSNNVAQHKDHMGFQTNHK